ncbi:hypothetical protein GGF32_009896 [Allomyces javanicus]|nr:hypothetical protein GGF32_009896 [Allomyces javanicus]
MALLHLVSLRHLYIAESSNILSVVELAAALPDKVAEVQMGECSVPDATMMPLLSAPLHRRRVVGGLTDSEFKLWHIVPQAIYGGEEGCPAGDNRFFTKVVKVGM